MASAAEVLRAVQDATGGHFEGVAIVRNHATAEEATAIGAKAFTRDATVFLPPGLGPLTEEPARSLLAHELVHVAQQHRHGPSLPHERSRPGRPLEREAENVAARVADRPVASTPPPAPPPHVATVDTSGTWVFPAAASAPSVAPSHAAQATTPSQGPRPVPAGVQRAPADEKAAPEPKPAPLDLDDLARRLYPRLRPYLRKELSLDRERAALVLGARR